jgi:DMSO/TMAO reductase YedYZ molybdopterin-dependent catalytic subunit
MTQLSRRKMLKLGAGTAAGLAGLAIADRMARRYGLVPPDGCGVYGPGETLTYASSRIFGAHAPAREFSRTMISAKPFANEIAPPSDEFKTLEAGGFRDWKLTVDGMVAHPMTFSVADLRAMTMRGQITEVACEEGWSYIAEWIGTPLSDVLRETGMLPQARYVVYRSIEKPWWESIDMADALHPQTIVASGMNDGDLPVAFGGPLRLRVPRQLGYKSVKFLNHITLTDSMKSFGKGLGSASPEAGYAWFAGI